MTSSIVSLTKAGSWIGHAVDARFGFLETMPKLFGQVREWSQQPDWGTERSPVGGRVHGLEGTAEGVRQFHQFGYGSVGPENRRDLSPISAMAV